MAIRKRHGANRLSYQVYWNNPFTGARETKTFHSLKEARAYDSSIRHRLSFDTESFRPQEVVSRTGADITLEDAVFLYLRDKNLPDKNLKPFLVSLKYALYKYGHIPICDFSRENWLELSAELKTKKKVRGSGLLSTAFIHGILSNLRTVIRWAHMRSMIDVLPQMPVPAPNYARTVPPTREEAERLFAVAPNHIKRVIVLGMMLGLRVGQSELFVLRWHNVDLIQGIVRIDTSRKNPRSPWREVPIHSALIPLFEDWQKEDALNGVEYVVSYNGKPITSIKKSWLTTLRAAGITRRVRPYDLRHAFATQLIANGEDVGTVARLLGHSSPQMVYQHYQHVSTTQKRNAVESLHVPSLCAK